MSAALLALLLAVPLASGEAASSRPDVGQAASSEAASGQAAPSQPGAATQAAATQAAQAPADYDTDLDVDLAEPDFTVVTLPTNLRVPRHKLAFLLTHRFARPLGEGDFSDLAADLFGFDGGAQMGFGLRFGLRRGTQFGFYRTSDRTIALRGQQELLREQRAPVGLSLLASVEGQDNFGLSDAPPGSSLHTHSPAFGLLVSRRLGDRGAVYVSPSWVGNTRVNPSAPAADDHTLLLGLGARLRVTRTMSLVAEAHPRLAGYAGDLGSGNPDPLATFGLEWRVGGHAFQLNVSNALATTPAQVARGAQGESGWFIGFNLTRKFY